MILWMSVRRGIRRASISVAEVVEQVARVVRAGRRLGVVLHAERRHVEAPQALERAVVQVPVA